MTRDYSYIQTCLIAYLFIKYAKNISHSHIISSKNYALWCTHMFSEFVLQNNRFSVELWIGDSNLLIFSLIRIWETEYCFDCYFYKQLLNPVTWSIHFLKFKWNTVSIIGKLNADSNFLTGEKSGLYEN